jgi:acetyl esterase/lipase
MADFHPDLCPKARFLPRSVHPRLIVGLLKLRARLRSSTHTPALPTVDGVTVRDFWVPSETEAHSVRVRLFQPEHAPHAVPTLLWLHGGGFVMGDPEIDEINNIAIVHDAGIAVASVDYRLAPRHRFPAPLDDCYTALSWLSREAGTLGVQPDRIAVGGSSAGAGLAAGLVLMAHDRQEVPVAFQMLLYPMLDDRTVLRTDIDMSNVRLWDNNANRYGWSAYLGRDPGGTGVNPYAAPARRADLTGLPSTWMGVGTLDLFHDEDLAYAQRLIESGVACELHIVTGAYHGFDLFSPKSTVVRQFRQSYLDALRRALWT